jgi:hypothetical protein
MRADLQLVGALKRNEIQDPRETVIALVISERGMAQSQDGPKDPPHGTERCAPEVLVKLDGLRPVAKNLLAALQIQIDDPLVTLVSLSRALEDILVTIPLRIKDGPKVLIVPCHTKAEKPGMQTHPGGIRGRTAFEQFDRITAAHRDRRSRVGHRTFCQLPIELSLEGKGLRRSSTTELAVIYFTVYVMPQLAFLS